MTVWGSPPLSLGTIAALTPLNFKTRIIDENIEEIDFNEHYDLVGITGNSYHIPRAGNCPCACISITGIRWDSLENKND